MRRALAWREFLGASVAMPLDSGGVTQLFRSGDMESVDHFGPTEEPSLYYGPDIGAALKAAREFRGLSLQDVSDATRIRRTYLAAVEDMRLDELPSRPFTLGYIKAEFDEFFRFYPAGAINPLTGAVVPVGGATLNIASTAVFQNTPEWTGNIGATWTTELAGGQLTVTPTASYRGDFSQFEFPSAVLDQQGYWLYDASVTWTSDTGNLKLGLHGKNLTDEEYRIGGYNFPQTAGVLFGNSVIGFYGPPRTVTATLSVKF